jgi:stage III sporulation protein AH
MQLNKQTVWLVTMLTFMVVLSAYYVATGPVEQAGNSTQQGDLKATDNQIDLNIKPVDQPAIDQKEKESMSNKVEDSYFVSYQLQRSTLRGKMTEEYVEVLSNPKATKEEIKEAERKLNELSQMEKQENVVEELIRKQGYRDAVVIKNNDQVDVIVQSDKLSKSQAVQLVTLVGQHMNVSANQISVAYVN